VKSVRDNDHFTTHNSINKYMVVTAYACKQSKPQKQILTDLYFHYLILPL